MPQQNGKMDDLNTVSDIKKKKEEEKGMTHTMGFPFHSGGSDCISLHQGVSLPGSGKSCGQTG